MPVLLTHPEVCAFLKVSRSTLRRWRAEGQFPRPDAMVGNQVRWKTETVLRWSGLETDQEAPAP
jgi:excisionase family DNA binding protein